MRKLVLIFAVMLLMLFGCVKINMTQKVEVDGSSAMTITMDYNQMIALSPDSMSSDPCKDVLESGGKNVTCKYADGIMTLSQKGDPTKYKFTTENGLVETKYKFEMDFSELSKTASAGSSSGMDLNSLKTPEAKAQLEQLKSMGLEMKYTIEMPGDVVSAEGGKIDKNKATFDLLDMFSNSTLTKITVESKTMNTTNIIIGLVGFVVVILVLLKVMKKI